jgi:trehalose-6-phosphatase
VRGAASSSYPRRWYVFLQNPQLLSLTIEIGAVVVEPIDFSKATAATQIFHILDMATPPRDPWKSPIDFLLVIGDGRDDEVIFRWANELGKDGVVANVTTCSLGSRNTEAGCTLTQGVTGMSFLFLSSTTFDLDIEFHHLNSS